MDTTETNENVLNACTRCGYAGDASPNDLVGSVSILEPLSSSNNPPSATEGGVLRKKYDDLSRAITSLDFQMNLLRANMEVLKREQLGSKFDVYKTVLHPCRCLPNEVLAIIFGLCVDEEVDIRKLMGSTLDTKKSPWVLGQVSRRWRKLALSLPHLWTTIDINWRREPIAPILNPYVERRLSLTLQRAQDRPLTVLWNQTSCDRAAVSILCSRSFHWKNAAIRAGIQGLRLLTPFSGAFPNLSDLHLHFETEAWLNQSKNDPIFSIFHDAPALHNLILSGDSNVTPRLSTQIPWSQITRLFIKGNSNNQPWSNMQMILPSLVNVEECFLRHFRFALPCAPPVRLTRLHSLDVVSTCTSSFMNLFQSITLPSLRILRIIPVLWESSPALLQFLHRSDCCLNDLWMSNDTDDLVKILEVKQLQTLRTFTMVGPQDPLQHTFSDTVLGALRLDTSGANTRDILPHLWQLNIDSSVKNWSDHGLVSMLASRRDIDHRSPTGSVSRLKYLYINHLGDGIGFEDAAAAAQLRTLIEGGLVVTDWNGKAIII